MQQGGFISLISSHQEFLLSLQPIQIFHVSGWLTLSLKGARTRISECLPPACLSVQSKEATTTTRSSWLPDTLHERAQGICQLCLHPRDITDADKCWHQAMFVVNMSVFSAAFFEAQHFSKRNKTELGYIGPRDLPLTLVWSGLVWSGLVRSGHWVGLMGLLMIHKACTPEYRWSRLFLHWLGLSEVVQEVLADLKCISVSELILSWYRGEI